MSTFSDVTSNGNENLRYKAQLQTNPRKRYLNHNYNNYWSTPTVTKRNLLSPVYTKPPFPFIKPLINYHPSSNPFLYPVYNLPNPQTPWMWSKPGHIQDIFPIREPIPGFPFYNPPPLLLRERLLNVHPRRPHVGIPQKQKISEDLKTTKPKKNETVSKIKHESVVEYWRPVPSYKTTHKINGIYNVEPRRLFDGSHASNKTFSSKYHFVTHKPKTHSRRIVNNHKMVSGNKSNNIKGVIIRDEILNC